MVPFILGKLKTTTGSVACVYLNTLATGIRTCSNVFCSAEWLDSIIDTVCALTVVDESLIRIVEMGPFTHRVDEGVELRKCAYECLWTLLDAPCQLLYSVTSASSSPTTPTSMLNNYCETLMRGLSIDPSQEIKSFMLHFLAHILSHTDSLFCMHLRLHHSSHILEALDKICKVTLKENAVKQEIQTQRQLELDCLKLEQLLTPTPQRK